MILSFLVKTYIAMQYNDDWQIGKYTFLKSLMYIIIRFDTHISKLVSEFMTSQIQIFF